MRFGAARYGPSAPWLCQFGKNDVLMRTGLPISDTWNEIESTSSWMRVTLVGVIAFSDVWPSCLMSMCFHDLGPDATQTLSSWARFVNHGAAEHSHAPRFGMGLA